ncbi:MAG: hypothetical protein OQL09_06650 [Gammaproteobacteria bacterium]|nr:hypothetical protein [Gammaproteobacteria bacterium]
MNRLIVLLITTLLSACMGTGSKIAGVQPPDWFHNPDIPGYIGFSAKAAPQSFGGIEAQQRVAESKARAELGRMARVQVQSRNLVRKSDQEGVDMQTASRLSSAEMLDLSRMEVREQWLHPVTGDLYIWVLLPKR